MTQFPDPPMDMMDVVLPFLKQNKEFAYEDQPSTGLYYRLKGTKSESFFYFFIGKKNTKSKTDFYWVSFYHSSKSSTNPTHKWMTIPEIKENLEKWLGLIKHHRSHFEEDEASETVAVAVAENQIDQKPSPETFQSYWDWAISEAHLKVTNKPIQYYELGRWYDNNCQQPGFSKEKFADFLRTSRYSGIIVPRKFKLPSRETLRQWGQDLNMLLDFIKKFWWLVFALIPFC